MQSRWTNDLQLDQLRQSSVQISTNLSWTSLKRQPRDANSTRPIDSGMIHSIELNLGYLKLVLIIRKHDSFDARRPTTREKRHKKRYKEARLVCFPLCSWLGKQTGSRVIIIIFLLLCFFSLSVEAKYSSFVEDIQERKCTLRESKERELRLSRVSSCRSL